MYMMDNPVLTESNFMGNSIFLQRVIKIFEDLAYWKETVSVVSNQIFVIFFLILFNSSP